MVEGRKTDDPLVRSERRSMPNRDQRRSNRMVREDDTLAFPACTRTPEDHRRAKRILTSDVLGRRERLRVRREEDLPVPYGPAAEVALSRTEGERGSAIVVGVLIDEEDISLGRIPELRLQFGGEKLRRVLEVGDAGGGGDNDGGLRKGEDVGEFGGGEDGVDGGELERRERAVSSQFFSASVGQEQGSRSNRTQGHRKRGLRREGSSGGEEERWGR